jgi:hypothetical protein
MRGVLDGDWLQVHSRQNITQHILPGIRNSVNGRLHNVVRDDMNGTVQINSAIDGAHYDTRNGQSRLTNNCQLGPYGKKLMPYNDDSVYVLHSQYLLQGITGTSVPSRLLKQDILFVYCKTRVDLHLPGALRQWVVRSYQLGERCATAVG